MRGDLRSVPQAIRLSQATMTNIRQNLIWAFGYNTALIPIAAGVLGAPLGPVPRELWLANPDFHTGTTLFDQFRVPRQVQEGHVVGGLEVPSLAADLRTDQHARTVQVSEPSCVPIPLQERQMFMEPGDSHVEQIPQAVGKGLSP